jgi:hypothetical protein
MISSEVQRTLVKSPPELWTELSDPAALGRHLGEFGDIRITRVEPEKTVVWEAERASGTVLIKPSGWGTRVTLTVTREIDEPEPPVASEPSVAPEATVTSEPPVEAEPTLEAGEDRLPEAPPEDRHEPAGELVDAAQDEPAETPLESETVSEYQPEPEDEPEAEPEPRRGFLARLFGRRRRERATELPTPLPLADTKLPDEEQYEAIEDGESLLESPGAHAVEPATAAAIELARERPEQVASLGGPPEVDADASPEPDAVQAAVDPQPSEEAQEGPDISADLKAAEEMATEEVTEVLTSMLDRLGTAHHRPFSRA